MFRDKKPELNHLTACSKNLSKNTLKMPTKIKIENKNKK
jgi:hypothetical protein